MILIMKLGQTLVLPSKTSLDFPLPLTSPLTHLGLFYSIRHHLAAAEVANHQYSNANPLNMVLNAYTYV